MLTIDKIHIRVKNKCLHKISISNFLEDGRIKASVHMGHTDKGLYKGSKLNDNRWHTLHFQRRGKTVELALDNELPEIGIYHLL